MMLKLGYFLNLPVNFPEICPLMNKKFLDKLLGITLAKGLMLGLDILPSKEGNIVTVRF